MTQRELDREVASATGESLSEIRRLGFSIENPAEDFFEPEPIAAPNVIDWDEHYRAELPRGAIGRSGWRRSRVATLLGFTTLPRRGRDSA